MFELATLIAGPAAAVVAWAAVCLTVPFVPHAWLIFPEMPGAMLVAWAALWLYAPLPARLRTWIWRGAVLGLLPWLHTKFVILLAAMIGALALRLWRQPKAVAAVIAPAAISAGLWIASFYVLYGSFDPITAISGTFRPGLEHPARRAGTALRSEVRPAVVRADLSDRDRRGAGMPNRNCFVRGGADDRRRLYHQLNPDVCGETMRCQRGFWCRSCVAGADDRGRGSIASDDTRGVWRCSASAGDRRIRRLGAAADHPGARTVESLRRGAGGPPLTSLLPVFTGGLVSAPRRADAVADASLVAAFVVAARSDYHRGWHLRPRVRGRDIESAGHAAGPLICRLVRRSLRDVWNSLRDRFVVAPFDHTRHG